MGLVDVYKIIEGIVELGRVLDRQDQLLKTYIEKYGYIEGIQPMQKETSTIQPKEKDKNEKT